MLPSELKHRNRRIDWRPYPRPVAESAEPSFPKGVSAPATRALVGAGYTDLVQLAGVSGAGLAKLHGMGPKALRSIQEALAEQGLSLGK